MPIEIRTITIKAVVEDKKEKMAAGKEVLDKKEINIEFLLDEIYKKNKTKNER